MRVSATGAPRGARTGATNAPRSTASAAGAVPETRTVPASSEAACARSGSRGWWPQWQQCKRGRAASPSGHSAPFPAQQCPSHLEPSSRLAAACRAGDGGGLGGRRGKPSGGWRSNQGSLAGGASADRGGGGTALYGGGGSGNQPERLNRRRSGGEASGLALLLPGPGLEAGRCQRSGPHEYG